MAELSSGMLKKNGKKEKKIMGENLPQESMCQETDRPAVSLRMRLTHLGLLFFFFFGNLKTHGAWWDSAEHHLD